MQVLDIQGYSYESSETILHQLKLGLVNSGGLILGRRAVTKTVHEVLVQFELRFIVDLYAAIIASGLDLPGCDHTALTDLCACRLHLMGNRDICLVVGLRIEVSFLKPLGSHNSLPAGCNVT